MELSYENEINLAFDKPLEYKNVLLYPATLPFYSIFASADECLDVSRIDERDIRLLRLPYLDYMYEKSLKDKSFKYRWDMLAIILKVVLGETQPFDIITIEGKIVLRVYQRSQDYEKWEKEYNEKKEYFFNQAKKNNPGTEQIISFSEQLKKIEEKMYKSIDFNAQDFEQIRQMIMVQNDIVPQHYNAQTEKLLYEMKQKLKMAQNSGKKSNMTLEDLVDILSYCTGWRNGDMWEMTIRRFNRMLDKALKKDDYYMYKQLELCGMIKMKSEVPSWTSHYRPKGKFDDILTDGGALLSSLGEENKI